MAQDFLHIAPQNVLLKAGSMKNPLLAVRACVCLAVLLSAVLHASDQRDFSTSEITKVIMLGTGNPLPDPTKSGPGVAVVVNGTPYIVDAGEGIWRAMGREIERFGGGKVKGFAMQSFAWKQVFITHLHSDHTLGLPAIILSPWNFHRVDPPHIYGPPGTKDLVDGILSAYRHDIAFRVYGDEHINDTGWRAVAHEIWDSGLVYEDDNVKVKAFKTEHSTAPMPYVYRFETPDKVIMISGDTRPTEGVLQASEGADIIIHEVFGLDHIKNAPYDASNAGRYHTSTKDLAELAKKTQPDILVLYHTQNYSDNPEQLVEEIGRFGFKGKVVESRDRDIF